MVDRIRDFRQRVQRSAAERVVPTAHGIGLLADSVASVYDANYLSVDETSASAAELAADADRLLAHAYHRRVIAEDADARLAAGFAELGYHRSTHLVMAHRREPDRRVDTSAVREVEFGLLAAPRTATILGEPWGDEEIARQLNDAKRLIMGAVPTRFFATIVGNRIAAYCDLRSDGVVAQIEDVEVVRAYRGRGLGRALVQHAVDEAQRGHEVVFLEALADDWPRELYAKLGFDVVDRRDFYTRFPHPLTRLRLRTPRLELRLTTAAELRQLYEVAAGGIHDPGDMPFGVPWTDDLDEEGFVTYHETRLAGARPDEWELALVVFFEDRPVGVQSLHGHHFGENRVAHTGSWLGLPWQRRGIGTEMRTAALAFAFDALGAASARSSAMHDNDASLGVSRKLGYETVGVSTVSPRGEPVPHADLELARERFRPVVPVEVEGFDTSLLPWFGVA